MAPPCFIFPVSQLPERVQSNVHGKRRKHADPRTRTVELSACEFFEMLQYNCEVQRPVTRDSIVQCFPVPRAFRRCQDKKGTFTVETTSWEGTYTQDSNPTSSSTADGGESKPLRQWSTSWNRAELQG
ncbi:Mitochondrial export protein Som1 [Geosmithia morbida]|uniref:Mitochondrial export protein Som1 n=1 Tax=Geosmithia morbida TaxID=1094350 RepID=A0A9P4YS17_9HYPO|nr:Mitochondrial export protein Som1 [Geosmithia morbida]KAF4121015.1 Mitochondrial export protein Som1 [Geosmithia morbida]